LPQRRKRLSVFNVYYVDRSGRRVAYSPRRALSAIIRYRGKLYHTPRAWLPRISRELFLSLREAMAPRRRIELRKVRRPRKSPTKRIARRVPERYKAKALWEPVVDFQERAERNLGRQLDADLFEADQIMHHNADHDVIHLPTKFVWYTKALPEQIEVFGRSKTFRVGRVWFGVYNTKEDSFSVWNYKALIPLTDYAGMRAMIEGLYLTAKRKIEKAKDYLEVVKFLAWTGYTLGQKAV